MVEKNFLQIFLKTSAIVVDQHFIRSAFVAILEIAVRFCQCCTSSKTSRVDVQVQLWDANRVEGVGVTATRFGA